MAIASGSGQGQISKPGRPKLPVRSNPTRKLLTAPITRPTSAPVSRSTSRSSSRSKPKSNVSSTPKQRPAPYSGYHQSMLATGGYNAVADQELRKTTPIFDKEALMKKIARRLSRRGGQGIYDPMIPIEGTPTADLSDFGQGADPINGGVRNHTGADISRPAGTPILAAVGGTVKQAASTGGAYGNQVILDHGRGEETMYGHLADFTVKPGQKVKKGEVIGFVGSTGRSTGNHLHWETWKDSVALDPASALGRDVPSDVMKEALKTYLRKHPEKASQVGPELFKDRGEGDGPSRMFENYNSPISVSSQAPEPTAPASPVGPQPSSQPTSEVQAFLKAIATQESGNDHSAVGVPTKYGTALGKYQILDSNIDGPGGWDMEALQQEITGEQFLNSPSLQEKIAKFKLRDYFKSYGAEGAAKAWYAGPDDATLDSNEPQYGGPSVNSYADQVLDLMSQYLQGGR